MADDMNGVFTKTSRNFVVFICLAIFPSLVPARTLASLYHEARDHARMVYRDYSSPLYDAMKNERFDDQDITLSLATVPTINGMNGYLDYIRTFEEPISDEPDFIVKHLQMLQMFKEALHLVRLDELAIRDQEGEDYRVFSGEVGHLRGGAMRMMATLRKIYPKLHNGEIYRGVEAGVTFNDCDDLDCRTKRGFFIVKEFNRYIELAGHNFGSLHTTHEAATRS